MYVVFRLLLTLIGVVVASIAGGFLLVIGEHVTETFDAGAGQASASAAALAGTFGLIISGFVFMYAAGPALMLGLVAELLALRSLLVFTLGGGAIGVLAATGWHPDWVQVDWDGPPLSRNPLAFPAAGVVGGAVYWLLVGSKAGLRRSTRHQRSGADPTGGSG